MMSWMANVLGATFLSTAQGMSGDFCVEAVGGEALSMQRAMSRGFLRSQCTYLATEIECIQAEIKQIVAATQEENWDYDGAQPASEGSLVRALSFTRHLWDEIPHPRISIDKKGRVMLAWEPDDSRYCSLTFDREDIYRCIVKSRADLDYTCITSSSETRVLEAIASVCL